jgi:hypothetical protein
LKKFHTIFAVNLLQHSFRSEHRFIQWTAEDAFQTAALTINLESTFTIDAIAFSTIANATHGIFILRSAFISIINLFIATGITGSLETKAFRPSTIRTRESTAKTTND